MVMRKRGRSFSRRSAKRPVQWVTNSEAWDGNNHNAYVANSLTKIRLLETGTSQALIGADTYLMAQRFTVLRIVGDFDYLSTAAAAEVRWTFGVILVDEVGSTGDAINPTVTSNADKSWLYLAHGEVGANVAGDAGNTLSQQPFPNAGHIDIRVKRVMRPDQQLTLVFAAGGDGFTRTNIRCLVSRVA